MKKVYILLLAMIYASVVFGQNKEVAVLQPRVIGGGTVSTNDKLIITSSMKKAFTQIDGYEAYSRTAQALIDAEQAFQRSGQVDESQIKAVGMQTGVAYICVFTLSKENNELVVNSDILNVVTGKIENSDFVVLLDVTDRENVMKQCQALAYSLLGAGNPGSDTTGATSGATTRPGLSFTTMTTTVTTNTTNNPTDPQAQYNLGEKYYDSKDYAEAIKWFRKSAEQEHAKAQYKLGLMYYIGHGVMEDYSEAVKLFRKSAEQGNADAQFELGFMYREGRGLAKSSEQAIEWFKKAARQGNEKATNLLKLYGITSY